MGKTVIVTGGSRGIGKEIVTTLAQEHQVILNYFHSEKEAKEIQEQLAKQGKQIYIFQADVSKREQVQQLVQFAIQHFSGIDVLINNAGIDQVKLFTQITDEDWNHVMETNLYSAFCMTQEVVKYMIPRQKGCIINISSIWGEIGASCETHYAVSKAGMDALTKSLAKELGPSNIRVNSIAPGIIDTQMNAQLSQQEKKQIKEEIPLNKIGNPKDIAKCVNWLIEDDYTTGQIISINGGWSI